MIYEVRQSTVYQYASPVAYAHHVLRLTPIDRPGQRVHAAALDILPAPVERYEGLDFFGDDSVGLSEADSGEFLGHCLYASARVLPKQLARWPHFASQWQFPEPPEMKALFQPADSHPQQLGLSARIRAIAIPFVGTGHAAATRIAAHHAFRALFQEGRNKLFH